jgi:hypothetical protein
MTRRSKEAMNIDDLGRAPTSGTAMTTVAGSSVVATSSGARREEAICRRHAHNKVVSD